MNIFIVNENPIFAARDLCNAHVCKMIVESAQLLCTAMFVREIDAIIPYRPTHKNHPCAIWTAATLANANWVLQHGLELGHEYTRRYNKRHKTHDVLEKISHHFSHVSWHDHQPFVKAMPQKYNNQPTIEAYRQYYIDEKFKFARWSPRATKPTWWPFND
jgi:hypothetical protein